MKKILFLFCFCFFLSSPLYALTIEGNVSYSIEAARHDAFFETPLKIDITRYSSFYLDKNRRINKTLLKKNINKYNNRYLTSFSDGTYAVSYINNLKVAYYYNVNGNLYAIDISDSTSYPRKSCQYNREGLLEGVSIDLSSKEQYIFDLNKKLVVHWIGDNCYDENGALIMTRN